MPDATSADARPAPDLERFGGIRWVRRTKGALTAKERRRMMGVVVASQGPTSATWLLEQSVCLLVAEPEDLLDGRDLLLGRVA